MKSIINSAFATLIVLSGFARAIAVPAPSQVELAVTAEREQPAGCPVVLDLTMTNVGKEPVSWWRGGPDKYPGAQAFFVQVRQDTDPDFSEVQATNGQYTQGSGAPRSLAPGASVRVPLAVPVRKTSGLHIRIAVPSWSSNTVEQYVQIMEAPEYFDRRRARMIVGALEGGSPFWQHVAERYADVVVLDAMRKMVTVDNALLVARAARVLAVQPHLPQSFGDDLAPLVEHWVPRPPLTEWGGLRESLVTAALKTRSEPARRAVLDLLRKPQDVRTQWVLIDGLRLSPGGVDWLRQARAAIVAAGNASPDDAETTRQVRGATNWIDSRIRHPDE